ncbi:helix-turn-helix domain-containing protein [Hymenobacter aerilatus]|uniref:Helix-turn-helix domain-containing protein n=1 Tax=Hymenobacter aerilatus TaxID=2932251 RepID=A0A8T9SW41_9BACT|nr:helix-turn-helix transcriptional regulator [Hymenobacter aerilatus]UOR06278.1 helix-turn-helix domain-containing protein [Hymenobacter aerilatus]
MRKHLDMNVTDFARHVGIDRSRYTRIETGPNKPALDAIEAVAERIPTVSLDWLLTGNGEMLRESRSLAPMPKDPKPQQPQAVVESAELKEVKDDRDKWRKMALELMEELRSRPRRQLQATGTDGESFNSDNDAAVEQPVSMSVSWRAPETEEELAA